MFPANLQHILALSAISLCIATPGCRHASSDHQEGTALSFQTEDSVAWHMLSNDIMIPFTSDIVIEDNTLHLLGMMDGKWLHSYNLTDMSCQSSIDRGQGPEDILQGVSLSVLPDGSFGIFDNSTGFYKRYDSTNKLIGSKNTAELFSGIWNTLMLDGSRCLVASPHKDEKTRAIRCSFSITNTDLSNTLATCADGLSISGEDAKIISTAPADIAISPDKKHFATVTNHGGILQLYSISGNEITSDFAEIMFPVKFKQTGSLLSPTDDSPFGFFAVCASDSLVFASFSDTPNEMDCTKIGVWDWTGRPIRLIRTDYPVIQLAYDKASNKIYGIVMNEEGFQIASIDPA